MADQLNATSSLAAYLELVYGEPCTASSSSSLCTGSEPPEMIYHNDMLPLSMRASEAHVSRPWPAMMAFLFSNHVSSQCFVMGGIGDRKCQKLPQDLSFVAAPALRSDWPGLLVYNPAFTAHRNGSARAAFADHSWVEVTRFASDCSPAYNVHNGDGLMPLHWRSNVRRHNGCWFYVAGGTGVFVNVGRALRTTRRGMDATATTIAKRYNMTYFGAGDDPLWCGLASRAGYDSIVLDVSHDRTAATRGAKQYINNQSPNSRAQMELVICNGGCATRHVRSACPPIELRTGFRAERPCQCDHHLGLVNCRGGGATPRLRLATCTLHPSAWGMYIASQGLRYNISQVDGCGPDPRNASRVKCVQRGGNCVDASSPHKVSYLPLCTDGA